MFSDDFQCIIDELISAPPTRLFQTPSTLCLRKLSTLTNNSSFNPDEQKFVCPCGRRFSLQPNYEKHLKIECGRVFKCNLCPILTTAKSSLVSHQKRAHNIKTTNEHYVSDFDRKFL